MSIDRNLLLVVLLLGAGGCARNASSEPSAATETDVAASAREPMARSEASTEATTAAGATAQATQEPAGPQEVTLELMEWDGIRKMIEAHAGKVVVVDCWATYCVPCRREFPGLVTLSRELPSDVVCISVSLDDSADQDAALEFLNEQQARFTNVLCTTDADTLYDQILKVGSIPAIFVYGRDGAVARTFTGANPDGGEYTYARHIAPFVRELVSQK